MNENMEKNENTVVVGNNNQEEKLFTQEQVNEIVKKRLERQKEASGNRLQELEARTKELETREAEFAKKEQNFYCKEYLRENGYPEDLMDILDTTDVDVFKTKADKASRLITSRQKVNVAPLANLDGPFKDANTGFERNVRHEPKGYWATDLRNRQ